MSNKEPIRIRLSESADDIQFSSWVLPEVGSSHLIGLETKKETLLEEHLDVTVLEDELESTAHMTLEEIEGIREQAYEEGFAKGREDGYAFGEKEGQQRGYQQGLDKAQEKINQQLELLEKALESLRQPLEQQQERMTEIMVEMVEHVAAAVIDFEVKANPKIISKAFSKALDMLPKQSEDVVIHVNPLDQQQIEDSIPRRYSHWQVIADDEISQGGCSIKTGASLIEFQLDSRFQDVVEQLYDRLYDEPVDNEDDVEVVDQ